MYNSVNCCRALVGQPPCYVGGLSNVRKQVENALALLGASRLGEDVPEAKCLVASACDDRLPVGRHGEVEHTERVASERGDLGHRRVPPQHNLVLRVTVRAHELV
jgi:hypothetical protein